MAEDGRERVGEELEAVGISKTGFLERPGETLAGEADELEAEAALEAAGDKISVGCEGAERMGVLAPAILEADGEAAVAWLLEASLALVADGKCEEDDALG